MNKKEIAGKIDNLLRDRPEIIFAYIFGSFVENDPFNDIDLAIYVDKDQSLVKGIFYEIKLSNTLEEKIKIPVDVIKLNNASDSVIYRATKGLLIKNNDEEKRVNFITLHWKKYWDFNHKIQEHITELKHGSR